MFDDASKVRTVIERGTKMNGMSSEQDALARVRVKLDAQIGLLRERERLGRKIVAVGIAGVVVLAGGGAVAVATIATPRMVESGVVCYSSLDASGPEHGTGFVDGQSLPTGLDAKIAMAVELCTAQGGSSERSLNAVCVRPDGLIAVFPKESADIETDVCGQVGYESAEKRS